MKESNETGQEKGREKREKPKENKIAQRKKQSSGSRSANRPSWLLEDATGMVTP